MSQILTGGNMDATVLIIEDDRAISYMLAKAIQLEFGVRAHQTGTLAGARQIIESGAEFFAAVVDLGLPDCEEGKAVSLTIQHKIPTLVLTATRNHHLRDRILRMDIQDYLTKGGRIQERVISNLRRIRTCRGTKVMVVDDSRASLMMYAGMLCLRPTMAKPLWNCSMNTTI